MKRSQLLALLKRITVIEDEGLTLFALGEPWIGSFLIYLSQNTDKSVEETHKDLMKGTKVLWRSS